jgi:hypothetical protein
MVIEELDETDAKAEELDDTDEDWLGGGAASRLTVELTVVDREI